MTASSSLVFGLVVWVLVLFGLVGCVLSVFFVSSVWLATHSSPAQDDLCNLCTWRLHPCKKKFVCFCWCWFWFVWLCFCCRVCFPCRRFIQTQQKLTCAPPARTAAPLVQKRPTSWPFLQQLIAQPRFSLSVSPLHVHSSHFQERRLHPLVSAGWFCVWFCSSTRANKLRHSSALFGDGSNGVTSVQTVAC